MFCCSKKAKNKRKATTQAQDLVAQAGAAAAVAAEKIRPVATQLAAQGKDLAHQGKEWAAPRVEHAAERIRPVAAEAAARAAEVKDKTVNEYLPKAKRVARAAAQELTASALIDALLDLAPPELRVFIEQSTERPLVSEHIGWVKLAFSYAVYELATGTDFEESLVRTIGRGGDTDTNAAIVGAVLGGVYGSEGIPQRWRDTVEKCTPGPGTMRPRPEEYWPPANVEDMAASLRQCGE